MSEILYKGIASALKIDAEELIAKLKTDGGEWLSEAEISKRLVSELTTAAAAATETAAEIARRKGQSEETNRLKRLVKSAGFENPDKLIGDELFEAFIAWKDEQKGDTPPADGIDKLSKDDLAKLPSVKSLIVEAVQAGAQKFDSLKKEYETTQSEFEKYKRGVVESETDAIARKRFETALEKGNVILQPEGLDIDRNERIEAAYHRFKAKYKVGLKDKNPIFVNDEGEEVLDLAFGKPLDYDEVAVNVAKPMYGVSAQNPNHAGSGIQQTAQNGKQGAYIPTHRYATIKEYDDLISVTADHKERLDIEKSKQHHMSKAAGN